MSGSRDEGEGRRKMCQDSPVALRIREMWRKVIQSAQAGHLQRRRLTATQRGYIPPALRSNSARAENPTTQK